MIKLITKKQPEIILKKEKLLRGNHRMMIRSIYKMKHYTILYDGCECIFVNPEIGDCERVTEILKQIFTRRFHDSKTEKLFDELKGLTDKETEEAILAMWSDWRKEVQKLELNEQAHAFLREIRRGRLYYKARKQREIIRELFDIGFGLYEPQRECNYQQGAENAFMYGYLMGMKVNGIENVKDGSRITKGIQYICQ